MCSFFPLGRAVSTWDFHLTCQSHSDEYCICSPPYAFLFYGLLLPHHSFWQHKNHLNAVWHILTTFWHVVRIFVHLPSNLQTFQVWGISWKNCWNSKPGAACNSVGRAFYKFLLNKGLSVRWGNDWNLFSANNYRSDDWLLSRVTLLKWSRTKMLLGQGYLIWLPPAQASFTL